MLLQGYQLVVTGHSLGCSHAIAGLPTGGHGSLPGCAHECSCYRRVTNWWSQVTPLAVLMLLQGYQLVVTGHSLGCSHAIAGLPTGGHGSLPWLFSCYCRVTNWWSQVTPLAVLMLLQGYQLVVTGHSLGAGVASVLALLLKPIYPDLICYSYSPPGCIFRFDKNTFVNAWYLMFSQRQFLWIVYFLL